MAQSVCACVHCVGWTDERTDGRIENWKCVSPNAQLEIHVFGLFNSSLTIATNAVRYYNIKYQITNWMRHIYSFHSLSFFVAKIIHFIIAHHQKKHPQLSLFYVMLFSLRSFYFNNISTNPYFHLCSVRSPNNWEYLSMCVRVCSQTYLFVFIHFIWIENFVVPNPMAHAYVRLSSSPAISAKSCLQRKAMIRSINKDWVRREKQ